MTMFDQYATATAAKDAPVFHSMDLGDNTLFMERRDPYGHIHFRLAHGTLPEKYQGAYTTFNVAMLHAGQYKQDRAKAYKEAFESLPVDKITKRKVASG